MAAATPRPIAITGEPAADALLDRDPFALLTGMLLDQQFPMERAFAGPQKIAERLGVDQLDPAAIAAQDPEEFAALCATPPAVHRYPGSMARRHPGAGPGDRRGVRRRHREPVDRRPTPVPSCSRRLRALPGFGDAKARIFVALLGKQRGVQPAGWEEAAGAYAEDRVVPLGGRRRRRGQPGRGPGVQAGSRNRLLRHADCA